MWNMFTFFLILNIGFSVARVCEFIGGEDCAIECEWRNSTIWTNCDGGWPEKEDKAIVVARGNYVISIRGYDIDLSSLIFGAIEGNETQVLILERSKISINSGVSTINNNGVLQVESAVSLVGEGILRNEGILISNGDAVSISLKKVENQGKLFVISGILKMYSSLDIFGTVNISKGEQLLLLGNNNFINGRIILQVDGFFANPILVNGTLQFGDKAVYEVQVFGERLGQYSQISAIGQVFLKGSIHIHLMPNFAPEEPINLSFLQSEQPLSGEFDTPVLDTEKWVYDRCVKCNLEKNERSVGLACTPCTITIGEYSAESRYRLKDMSFKFILPVLVIMIAIVIIIMGATEIIYCISERRQNRHIRIVDMEIGTFIME